MRRALGLGLLALTLTSGAALADDELLVSLDATTPLAMAPGDTLVVNGRITSSALGEPLDAARLFDAPAGGLEILPVSELDHLGDTVSFRATGAVGPSCAAERLASPCLVPRLGDYAHKRLMTTADFRRTLSGHWSLDVVPAPVAAAVAAPRSSFAAPVAAMGGLLAIAGAFVTKLRRRKRTPIGEVYAAALTARKATRGDLTLATIRVQIDELVARADMLDAARAESKKKLLAIDRASLEKKREAWSRSTSPDAPDAVEWVTEELAEAARIESDLASSLAGLERIAAALRVLALRARRHRGTRARATTADPVDVLASELDHRDAALSEAARL